MIIIYIAGIFLFSLRIIMFSIGTYRERKAKIPDLPNGSYPFVSVVIPARNEENNISDCLNSLNKCNYPADRYEIVAVNDRSTDRTGEIIEKLKESIPNLKLINKKESDNHSNLKGKAGALQTGIESAKGDIILMTDADCTVTPNWIRTVASVHADGKVGLSSSYTNVKGSRIFDKLQAAEWAYMHSMGAAGVGLKQPLGCYGNNMAVRKDVFQRIGGYKSINFSVTEDLALQREVFKSGKKVRYITHAASAVETLPCKNFKEYIAQHHRWAIGGLDLGWRAAVFVITSASLWLAIATALITLDYFWLATILCVRLAGDFALVAPSLKILGKNSLIKWIFPGIFFFMIMELIVPFLLIDRNIVWKGQVFKKT